MIEFGSTLRRAREQAGLSPSQVAERTHLMVQIVQDLENDNFSRIVAPIYGRGFVKLYCEAVGIRDPQPLVADFMTLYNKRGETGVDQAARTRTPSETPAAPQPIAAEELLSSSTARDEAPTKAASEPAPAAPSVEAPSVEPPPAAPVLAPAAEEAAAKETASNPSESPVIEKAEPVAEPAPQAPSTPQPIEPTFFSEVPSANVPEAPRAASTLPPPLSNEPDLFSFAREAASETVAAQAVSSRPAPKPQEDAPSDAIRPARLGTPHFAPPRPLDETERTRPALHRDFPLFRIFRKISGRVLLALVLAIAILYGLIKGIAALYTLATTPAPAPTTQTEIVNRPTEPAAKRPPVRIPPLYID